MRRHEFNAVFRAIEEMSWSQRRQLLARLQSVQAAEEVHRVVEERAQRLPACPSGCGLRTVRNGLARGWQRYKCSAAEPSTL
jgi:transposase-like protein